MRILIACEESQEVAQAFRKKGHEAWSCDLLPSAKGLPYHIQGDVLEVIKWGCWDAMIAHPPCTRLAVSGARWFKEKGKEQEEALAFVKALMDAPIKLKAIENPVSIISSRIRKPDQIIQPWQFGHGEVKATCFWLYGFPKLKPSKIVEGREAKIWKMPPSPDRAKMRSRTYPGIAEAMAEQWGNIEVANDEI